MNTSKPKIIIEHLIKIYGNRPRKALEMFRAGESRDSILEKTGNVLGVADVSLNINKGDIFVVMGLSGSGKSTLIRCLNRLIKPTSGHIYVDDEDVAHVDEEQMRQIRLTKMSMVFQKFGLFPHRSVAENVEYGLKVKGIDQDKRREKALETLEMVGLAQWADYLPSSLSGGMQQRVGLARALATDAEILLMDEAFSALDPLIRREMQDELLRLQKDLHKTIVFISHDIHEALKIGDQIALMQDGGLVQVGSPMEIITQPANDYIRGFTHDVNRAQVLTVGAISHNMSPLVIDKISLKGAIEKMNLSSLEYNFVVDSEGKPIGFVKKSYLDSGLHKGKETLSEIMLTEIATIPASSNLENTFSLFKDGLPLAVINHDGSFKGSIELFDVISHLSPDDSAIEN